MADNRPLVSIGMPVYNGERYIRQALDTLVAQTFTDFELIISDNASIDSTSEICLEYAARDKRIRYYRNDRNMGATWNFNRVFELSSGEYFMWACHDDYWQPQYLRFCLKALTEAESIILAGAMCDSVDSETGKLIYTDVGFSTTGLCPRERFVRYRSIIHGGRHIGGIFCGIYRRSALREVIPAKKVIASDHLVLAELCFQGEFVTVREKLMVKRRGGASTNHKTNAHALSITNPLLIWCPYFVRELLMQKIIFQETKLAWIEKLKLSCWSAHNYVQACLIRSLRRKYHRLLGSMKATVKALFDKLRGWRTSAAAATRIKKYIASDRKPWTAGYKEYKENVLRDVLENRDLLDCFLHNKALPPNYGFRLDERIIEYPWILTRLGVAEGLLLDAGSALNHEYTLDHPALRSRSLVIYNLSPEKVVRRSNISYIYGDLRYTILKDESFDEIVCISTLEHVGMNNTLLYSKDTRFNEFRPNDYLDVVREFKRLLKPGGKLLITVPYGHYENLGWLQQFDFKMLKAVVDAFGASPENVAYYKYFADGWQIADANACADCSYFDIHKSNYESDYVAAARAVACIEMVK